MGPRPLRPTPRSTQQTRNPCPKQPTPGANPAAINDLYDYNRDKKVNSTDQIIARNNGTTGQTALQSITVP